MTLDANTLAELRKKAEAAPAGKWVYTPDDGESGWVGTTTSATRMSAGHDGQWMREFCEYAVSAQPKVILALLDRIVEMEGALGEISTTCESKELRWGSNEDLVAKLRACVDGAWNIASKAYVGDK